MSNSRIYPPWTETKPHAYWRRVQKIWATRQDLRQDAVLKVKGAESRFVRAVMRGKTKDQASVTEIRLQLAELVKTYDIVRLIGDFSLIGRRSHPPV